MSFPRNVNDPVRAGDSALWRVGRAGLPGKPGFHLAHDIVVGERYAAVHPEPGTDHLALRTFRRDHEDIFFGIIKG